MATAEPGLGRCGVIARMSPGQRGTNPSEEKKSLKQMKFDWILGELNGSTYLTSVGFLLSQAIAMRLLISFFLLLFYF